MNKANRLLHFSSTFAYSSSSGMLATAPRPRRCLDTGDSTSTSSAAFLAAKPKRRSRLLGCLGRHPLRLGRRHALRDLHAFVLLGLRVVLASWLTRLGLLCGFFFFFSWRWFRFWLRLVSASGSGSPTPIRPLTSAKAVTPTGPSKNQRLVPAASSSGNCLAVASICSSPEVLDRVGEGAVVVHPRQHKSLVLNLRLPLL